MVLKKRSELAEAVTESNRESVSIPAPRFDIVAIQIKGTAPLVLNRFSQKAAEKIRADQAAGSTGKSKKTRAPKDFDALYEGAMYKAEEGWHGFHAASIRNAMISACRTVDFKMTLAKLSVFVEADGFDALDSTPLVRIRSGRPEQYFAHARNANGNFDQRIRPMWKTWSAILRIRFDADRFTRADVVNLISRVGQQVGIGEGRPDSKNSAGLGFGLFEITN